MENNENKERLILPNALKLKYVNAKEFIIDINAIIKVNNVNCNLKPLIANNTIKPADEPISIDSNVISISPIFLIFL